MALLKLSRQQKTILQKALNENSFELMQQIATELLSNWSSGTMVHDTAFKTAAEAIGREERKRALKVFLEELHRLSFQHDEG